MTPKQLIETLAEAGSRQYGDEAVSQLEHALQCAALANVEDGRPEMVAAALFHDVGHLVHKTDTILGAYRFPIAAFHLSGSSSNVSHIAQPVDSLLPRQ